VDKTARAEREEADRHPFGSAEKQAALLRMKHAELAARNQPGGYWVAAAARGMPPALVMTWCFEPGRRRSTGLGPVLGHR
jgi:hypothetical protein